MKKLNLEFILFTVAGAIIGNIAVDQYRKHKARMAAEKAQKAVPNELLIIEKL